MKKLILNSKISSYSAILCCVLGFQFTLQSFGQKTKVNFFGHVDASLEKEHKAKTSSTFSLGEHDFFITSAISEKWSFLGEMVLNPNTTTGFNASIERARIKFDYTKNHSVIVGKVHTPVNYWNDVYHHGRLFFPTIDRPMAFSTVVPIHTLGLRLQGQNISKLKFGYDLVIGNGMSSYDLYDLDKLKSYTIAVHIKPKKGVRISASYYRDKIVNGFVGNHIGHNSAYHNHSSLAHHSAMHNGVLFELFSFSGAIFKPKFEGLSEFSVNLSKPKMMAQSQNLNSFTYLGYRFQEANVVFGIFDYTAIDDNETHIIPLNQTKFGLGFRRDFSHLVVGKLQLERYTGIRSNTTGLVPNKFEIKIQIAYGF